MSANGEQYNNKDSQHESLIIPLEVSNGMIQAQLGHYFLRLWGCQLSLWLCVRIVAKLRVAGQFE
jgi:hypothetical protein